MKRKFYPFTICYEEESNYNFSLGQELELETGDTFEKKFTRNCLPIKYQVLSTTDGVILIVKEVKE